MCLNIPRIATAPDLRLSPCSGVPFLCIDLLAVGTEFENGTEFEQVTSREGAAHARRQNIQRFGTAWEGWLIGAMRFTDESEIYCRALMTVLSASSAERQRRVGAGAGAGAAIRTASADTPPVLSLTAC